MNTLETIYNLTVEAALEWIDSTLYAATATRLSDLERQVFLGSWRDLTYEQIHPLNPQYVEKSVGYKLWQKLSELLGEKVSKKRLQGVVKRSIRARLGTSDAPACAVPCGVASRPIRITHCQQDQAAGELATALTQFLQTAGHRVELETWEDPAGATQSGVRLGLQGDWILLINPVGADSPLI